ncbi:MAG: APC family permease [Clostridiales Family XIII bacterium]|jgi:amino acid transporter|nr:APC family permease [Clostridiales Family XIII bacterium]
MRYNGRSDYEDFYDGYDEYEEYEEPQPYFLSARDLIFYCLAFMTPAAAALVYGKAQAAAHGALAGSYLVAIVLIFLTLLSYRRLNRAFHEGGSVFLYAGHGIHRRAGLFTGWAALLFYIMASCAFFLIGAKTAAEMFAPVPYTFWLILIAVVSVVVVLFGQRLSSRVVTVVTLGVIGITAIYILVCFMAADKGVAPDGVPKGAAFSGTDAGFGAVMSGAAIACLSFLGFDSATTLTEETRNAKTGTGKVMAIACAAAAALFFFQTLASATIMPDYTQFAVADDGTGVMKEIAFVAGGSPMQALLTLSMILASFGVGIVAITAASRMLGILTGETSKGGGRGAHSARGGGLLSDLLPQAGVPPMNIIICFAVTLVIAFVIPDRDALFAFDLARFAGMICFMLVNAAALIYFWFKRHDPVYTRSLIIPAAGFLASLWAWINIDPDTFGIGVVFALVGVIIIAASYLYERLGSAR